MQMHQADDMRLHFARQQTSLANHVSQKDFTDFSQVTLVGGLDISYSRDGDCRDGLDRAVAALVVLQLPDLRVVLEDYERCLPSVPYEPGFLGFREVPEYQKLLARTAPESRPEVVLVDGFGVLHPRGCGSASHLGVLTGLATIGCAKALLHLPDLDERQVRAAMRQGLAASAAVPQVSLGQLRHSPEFDDRASAPKHSHDMSLASPASAASVDSTDRAGGALFIPQSESLEFSTASTCDNSGLLNLPLISNGKLVGMAVRTAASVSKPVYVSVGHQISLPSAVALIHRCSRFRVPEPIRQADIRSRQQLRIWLQVLA